MKIVFNVVLFIYSAKMISQTIISGKIADVKSQQPLSYANICLKSAVTPAVLAYEYADETGRFNLKTNACGTFMLTVSALNFDTVTVEIEIKPGDQTIKKDFLLNARPIALSEIVIASEKKITQKKDTIVFNARSFATGNEKVVEDLLKKIPGIMVGSDGTIKVGNQEVEKIMIDGDDFFEKGYKLLTKNMPSAPVDKIELYQHYANNKHLKNIEHSDKVALNLKLKGDAKRKWFGDLQLAYGLASENRYEIHGNLMNFGNQNKYYFITNLNNTGINATGDISHLIRPLRDNEPGSVGDGQSAAIYINIDDSRPDLKDKRVNFNNAEMGSLNSIFTLSAKSKIKTLLFVNTDENDFYSNSFESYLLGNDFFENTESAHGKSVKATGFCKVDFNCDFSANKTLEYSAICNLTKEKNKREVIFNNAFLDESMQNENQRFDQKIVFTDKLKKNSVFITTARFIDEKSPQKYNMEPFLYRDIFMQDAQNSLQKTAVKMQFSAIESHLMNRGKNNDLFEIKIGNQIRKDHIGSAFFLNSAQGNLILPSNYQNDFTYSSDDLYIDSKYRFAFKTFSLLAEANMHQLFNAKTDFEDTGSQRPFFINPKFSANWAINKTSKLSASYHLSKTNAAVQDVFNHYINTGFRAFSKGTGSFNQLLASNASIGYDYGDWTKRFFIRHFLDYTKNHDFISTSSQVSENFSQSEKITIKNRRFINFSSNAEKYIPEIKNNLKFIAEASESGYQNEVNGSGLREIKSQSLNYGLELRSGFKGLFNYHFGFRNNHNTIKTGTSNSYTNNIAFLDLYFMVNKKLDIQIQTERYYFGNIENATNTYYFADFEARYVFKAQHMTLSMIGNNISGTQKFKSYSITDISISKTEYRLQPRYVLLKLEFNY